MTKWTRQVSGENPFPVEYDWSTTGPVWVWHDVNEWLRATGRVDCDDCSLSREDVEEADRWIAGEVQRVPTA